MPHVKPSSPDLVVRDPASGVPIPAEGREVQLTTYWYRRLAAGDVVECAPPTKAPAPIFDAPKSR